MNGQLELRIITQPYSAVYWGYFRRSVFGNSLTKQIKLSSFSYSVVILFLPISYIPPCFHANPPDVPRLIGPREFTVPEVPTLTHRMLMIHVYINNVISLILVISLFRNYFDMHFCRCPPIHSARGPGLRWYRRGKNQHGNATELHSFHLTTRLSVNRYYTSLSNFEYYPTKL